jgi:predicted outer membrane protein
MFLNVSGGIAMKKLIAPLIMAGAICGQALAQSAVETQERPAAGQRSTTRQGAPGAAREEYDAQRTTTTTAQGQGNKLDQHLAACLTLGNQEEIALAQFAQERAQNPQVKQFAQMMIEEHQQAVSQLQKAVPQLASLNLQLKGAEGSTERGAETSTTRATTNEQAASTTDGAQRAKSAQGSADPQMLELGRAIKEECLALTQAELGRKQGADFDKCYIGQQLVSHTAMLAELKAGQRFASNQLKPVLQQGAQMAEHHLAQARTIMEQLDASGGANPPQNAQRPGAGTQPPRR